MSKKTKKLRRRIKLLEEKIQKMTQPVTWDDVTREGLLNYATKNGYLHYWFGGEPYSGDLSISDDDLKKIVNEAEKYEEVEL